MLFTIKKNKNKSKPRKLVLLKKNKTYEFFIELHAGAGLKHPLASLDDNISKLIGVNTGLAHRPPVFLLKLNRAMSGKLGFLVDLFSSLRLGFDGDIKHDEDSPFQEVELRNYHWYKGDLNYSKLTNHPKFFPIKVRIRCDRDIWIMDIYVDHGQGWEAIGKFRQKDQWYSINYLLLPYIGGATEKAQKETLIEITCDTLKW